MITRFFHRREWALMVIGAVLIICQVYFDFRIPEYMEDITNSYLKQQVDVVERYGVEMVVCAFLSFLTSLAVGFILANMAASVGRNIRIAQFDKVQSFAMQDINKFSAASLITRSTNDVYQVQNFIARGTQVMIKGPIIAIWAVCKIYDKHVDWLVIVVAGLLAIVLVMGVTLHFATPLFKKIQWFTDGVNRSTRESLDGIRVIRAYNAEGFQESRFEESNRQLLDNNVRSSVIMAPGYPIASSMSNFITLGIYWVGASIIMGASSTDQMYSYFTDMIVITSYSAMVVSAFMMFIGIFRMLPRAMVGIKRIEEVVDTESSIRDGKETEGCGSKGEVEFRNVSFSYPGSSKKVLDGVSFKVEPGKTFAIIGSVGCGKSSLVNLAARFYDATEGSVLVDGRDVKDYQVRSLHLKIGYVPQNAIIFSGSVESNVNYGYGSENRTEEDVRRALRIAQAEDFVETMPEGLQSHISQHGRNVSGGQKQRISIARAVCRSPEIYIFDDTFSALDYKTDRALRSALRKETVGSTVIIVAQRIGTIRDADEIMVLDEGRVVGMGTHGDLMKNCGVYRDIARSQLSEEELA